MLGYPVQPLSSRKGDDRPGSVRSKDSSKGKTGKGPSKKVTFVMPVHEYQGRVLLQCLFYLVIVSCALFTNYNSVSK